MDRQNTIKVEKNLEYMYLEKFKNNDNTYI